MTTAQGRVPLCVYVLFHPRSSEARRHATEIFRWLRLATDEQEAVVMGLPVYFRSELREGHLHPRINYQDSENNVLVALIDDHMAADKGWRQALRPLLHVPGAFLLPAMLSPAAGQLGDLSEERQPLRLFRPSDPRPADPEDWKAADTQRWFALRSPRLRRALTEALCRRLLPATRRLKVFISHAKADGRQVAEQLRDGLASVSQLEPWFDENDIATGSAWVGQMKEAARSSTGGMICVLSPAYASRPWCWEEADQAREPRKVPPPDQVEACSCQEAHLASPSPGYTCLPAVGLLVAAPGWSALPPPVARIPHLHWEEGRGAEIIAHLVDRLLLELLLQRFFQLRMGARPLEADERWMDHLPDPLALARIGGDLDRTLHRLIYPGVGLRRTEQRMLDGAAKALLLKLCPLEDRMLGGWPEPASEGSPMKGRPLVAIAAGGLDPDLRGAGIGEEHVEDLMVRLSRLLLRLQLRVAYGGSLTPQASNRNFLRAVMDTALGWTQGLASQEPGEDPEDTAPLVNFSALRDAPLPVAERARQLGVCSFREVGRPPPKGPELPAERSRRLADNLRRMRELMAQDCGARIFFSGKVHGADGWIPGIAEELCACLEQGQPFLLIGRMGGCAGLIAEFLRDPKADWPGQLRLGAERRWREERGEAALRDWLLLPPAERQRHYQHLQRSLVDFRRALHSDSPPAWLGAQRGDWLELLDSDGGTQGLKLVLKLKSILLYRRSPSCPPSS